MWLDRVKRAYKNDLEITWKNFSLQQVNSKEGPEWKVWEQDDVTEPNALLAQIAAEASRKQGDELYQKYHLALLTARHGGDGRIPLNDEETLLQVAEQVGLDVGQLREDMKDPDLAKIVGRDHEGAVEQGIFGTPTFVFDSGNMAYIKTLIPPAEDAVAEFEHFVAVANHRNYMGELKRPQPPWPKGAFD